MAEGKTLFLSDARIVIFWTASVHAGLKELGQHTSPPYKVRTLIRCQESGS